MNNPFGTLQEFTISGNKKGKFHSLPALGEKLGVNLSRLPVSIRIVLESVLRNCDGLRITPEHVRQLAAWTPNAPRSDEIPFVVSRVVLQDFTGVPAVVDDCDVVLDDPHLAAHHALITSDDAGQLVVQALPSINGVRLGEHSVAIGSALSLPADGLLSLGASRIRIRRAGEALAPEKPLARVNATRWLSLGLLAVALLLVLIGEQWLDAEPGRKLSEFLMPLFALPMSLTLWSLMWGLGSKLFQRHFIFLFRCHVWHSLYAVTS